ncbi:hypothetical protein CW745_15015 [Psychromonas sp. psych-6C06]|uniref:T6SS effector amidase Tae4 family protein n=1 Tax=Psychromonas sp. psych-6C06 TaxID=2058089 RepID=UPI000C3207D5|nr:T6SS effector amidase Tae4 family protein [Psychromonas sp. psych-6C06]PKF60376.1 hypothetical protein CW745_15015 [Psychromonas sp. psych-6C06]
MRPSFHKLSSNFYSATAYMPNYLSGDKLYDEVGLSYQGLIKQNAAYANTCATRMSLALLKSGIIFDGRLQIKSGKFKGRYLETGAKLLADQLMRPSVFGKPKIYRPNNFSNQVLGSKGVVLFWKIDGYGGGHIDLIDSTNVDNDAECSSACYYDCREIWFWELK